MKKKIFVISALTIFILLVFCSCSCEHEWIDATCTTPKTCSLCDETDGEPLSHNWQDATCTTPKICSLCDKTDGEPLGHTESDFEFKKNDYINATTIYAKKCTVCGDDIEETERSLESLCDNDMFQISPHDFYKRLKQIYAKIDDDMDIRNGTNGDQFVCGYLRDGKQLGFIQFSNSEGNITSSQKNEACFDGIMGIISSDISDVLSSLIMTCDPTQTETDALAIALSACATGEEKEVNGIIYQCRVDGSGGGIVWVDIKK